MEITKEIKMALVDNYNSLNDLMASVNAMSPGAQAALKTNGIPAPTSTPVESTAPVDNEAPADTTGSNPPPEQNFFQKYIGGIKDAYNAPDKPVGEDTGNAIGAALAPVTNTVSAGLNGVGGAIHGVTAPLMQKGGFLNNVLSAYGQAAATAPIGQNTQQLYQMIGGVTGNPMPNIYGGGTVGGVNGDVGTALPTSQDATVAQAQAQVARLTPLASTFGPQQKTYQEALKNAQEILDKARAGQVSERANAASIGTFKPGDGDMQELATLGQTSARMHELIPNLANDIKRGDSQAILADFGAISKDENLMQSIKRQNPALAGEIQSSFDEFGSPLASASGLLVPEKLKGSLQGLVNNALIEDHSFQTKLNASQANPDQQKVAGTRLNEHYGKPYFGPETGNTKGLNDSTYFASLLTPENLKALSDNARNINVGTARVGAQAGVESGAEAVKSGAQKLAEVFGWKFSPQAGRTPAQQAQDKLDGFINIVKQKDPASYQHVQDAIAQPNSKGAQRFLQNEKAKLGL